MNPSGEQPSRGPMRTSYPLPWSQRSQFVADYSRMSDDGVATLLQRSDELALQNSAHGRGQGYEAPIYTFRAATGPGPQTATPERTIAQIECELGLLLAAALGEPYIHPPTVRIQRERVGVIVIPDDDEATPRPLPSKSHTLPPPKAALPSIKSERQLPTPSCSDSSVEPTEPTTPLRKRKAETSTPTNAPQKKHKSAARMSKTQTPIGEMTPRSMSAQQVGGSTPGSSLPRPPSSPPPPRASSPAIPTQRNSMQRPPFPSNGMQPMEAVDYHANNVPVYRGAMPHQLQRPNATFPGASRQQHDMQQPRPVSYPQNDIHMQRRAMAVPSQGSNGTSPRTPLQQHGMQQAQSANYLQNDIQMQRRAMPTPSQGMNGTSLGSPQKTSLQRTGLRDPANVPTMTPQHPSQLPGYNGPSSGTHPQQNGMQYVMQRAMQNGVQGGMQNGVQGGMTNPSMHRLPITPASDERLRAMYRQHMSTISSSAPQGHWNNVQGQMYQQRNLVQTGAVPASPSQGPNQDLEDLFPEETSSLRSSNGSRPPSRASQSSFTGPTLRQGSTASPMPTIATPAMSAFPQPHSFNGQSYQQHGVQMPTGYGGPTMQLAPHNIHMQQPNHQNAPVMLQAHQIVNMQRPNYQNAPVMQQAPHNIHMQRPNSQNAPVMQQAPQSVNMQRWNHQNIPEMQQTPQNVYIRPHHQTAPLMQGTLPQEASTPNHSINPFTSNSHIQSRQQFNTPNQQINAPVTASPKPARLKLNVSKQQSTPPATISKPQSRRPSKPPHDSKISPVTPSQNQGHLQ